MLPSCFLVACECQWLITVILMIFPAEMLNLCEYRLCGTWTLTSGLHVPVINVIANKCAIVITTYSPPGGRKSIHRFSLTTSLLTLYSVVGLHQLSHHWAVMGLVVQIKITETHNSMRSWAVYIGCSFQELQPHPFRCMNLLWAKSMFQFMLRFIFTRWPFKPLRCLENIFIPSDFLYELGYWTEVHG